MSSKKLSSYFDDYLDHLVAMGKSKSTATNYRLYLNRFIDFTGDISIDDFKHEHIVRYLNHLMTLGLESTTRSYHIVALRSLVKFLNRNGFTGVISSTIEIPKTVLKEMPYLLPEEIAKILKACETPRDRTIIAVLSSTGMRVSELINLNKSDIDLVNQEIHIRRGKGGKPRIAFLTPETSEILEEHMKKSKGEALFSSPLGPGSHERITPRSIQRLIKTLADKCGIAKEKAHPHAFRHGLASSLLRKGTNLRYIQALLGHANPSVTANYTHVQDEDLKKVFLSANDRMIQQGKITNGEYVTVSKEYLTSLYSLLSRIVNEQQEIRELLEDTRINEY